MFCYSKSISLLGSLTNASASGVSFVYIGTRGETAEQTVARVNALQALSGISTAATTATTTALGTTDSAVSNK
jgi:hypothetical protein